ncbi:MAG TPA: hypothetical protein VFW73_01035, partial [Lacipirellulaceae bacterium]|nr:hypothetical protein [Lacipirellulaceae bacterium]
MRRLIRTVFASLLVALMMLQPVAACNCGGWNGGNYAPVYYGPAYYGGCCGSGYEPVYDCCGNCESCGECEGALTEAPQPEGETAPTTAPAPAAPPSATQPAPSQPSQPTPPSPAPAMETTP